jgi:hypothetical protein
LISTPISDQLQWHSLFHVSGQRIGTHWDDLPFLQTRHGCFCKTLGEVVVRPTQKVQNSILCSRYWRLGGQWNLFFSFQMSHRPMAPAIQQVQVVVEATAVTNRSRWFRVRVLLLTSRMSTRQQEREAQSDSIVQVEKSRLVQQVQVVVGDRASFSSNQWVKVVSNPTSCYRPAGCRLIQVDSTAGTRSPIGFHSPRLAYSSLMIIQTSRRHEQKGTFLTILASGLGIN